jgi:hypothetical protein
VADLREALGAAMSRLSEGEQDDRRSVPEAAGWFWLTRFEVPFSAKYGPRPYLCLAADDVGMITLYPRTTPKGASPKGNHFPDQVYPRGVLHRAHAHVGRGCRLRSDATVLACAPQTRGAYILRLVTRDCVEQDAAWLTYFCGALGALADEEPTAGGGDGH